MERNFKMKQRTKEIKRLLVIDDDRLTLHLIESFLSNHAVEVCVSRGEEDVFSLIHSFQPDVILIDIYLSETTGILLLREIKNDPEHKEIPVVIMSSDNDQETIVMAFSAGAIEFISKPLHLPELFLRISVIFNLLEIKQKYHQKIEKLNQNNQEKDELMRTISHDIRSPLSGISSLAESLAEELKENDSELAGDASLIMESADKLLGMLTDFLSQYRDMDYRFAGEYVNLTDSVLNACQVLQLSVEKKGMKISFDCPDNVMVFADRNLLDRLILNILSNSIKFSDQGKTVKIIIEEHSEEIRLLIIDQGVGRDLDNINRRTGTDGEKGFGLGIPIIYRIIEQIGADIDYKSSVGSGTEVTVTFNKVRKLES